MSKYSSSITNRKSFSYTLFGVALFAFSASAQGWSWRMPAKHLQNLDFSKRAAIERAERAFSAAQDATRRNIPLPDQIPFYRNAAAEWKKYAVQYELDAETSDDVNAYVAFMQAYSLQGARDRNTAIKLYEEVLDFYRDSVPWVSAPAQYMIAEIYRENGETRRAQHAYQEMIDDPKMADHVLAAGAYNRLAGMAWSQKKFAEAEDLWRNAADDRFKKEAKGEYDAARDNLKQYAVLKGSTADIEQIIFDGVPENNSAARCDRIRDAIAGFEWCWHHKWPGWYFSLVYPDDAKREKARNDWWRTAAKWYDSYKTMFEENGRDWEHATRSFRNWRNFDRAEAKKRIPVMGKILKDTPETNEKGETPRANRANNFIDILCDCSMHDEAFTVLEYIKNPLAKLWATERIEERKGDWKAALITLDTIIAQKDAKAALEAKNKKAWIYKDRTREYDKAAEIYLDISDPPRTLWPLQECYRALGKKTEAYAVLNDIAFFPQEAPRAVLTQARYREQDGEKEQAISLYRRLLSHPEWKKTGESSQAHQALERLGIATGGAVINEVR